MTNRTRSRGGLTAVTSPTGWWTISSKNGILTDSRWSNSPQAQRLGTSETMSDYVVHNFRKAVAGGGIVNNPASYTRITKTGSDTGWKIYKKFVADSSTGETWEQFGESQRDWMVAYGPAVLPAVDASLLTEMVLSASTEAHANIKNPRVQSLVAIGEVSRTLSMLTNPLKGLTDFIRDRRKWEKYRGRKPKGSTHNQSARDRTARESLRDGIDAAAASWLEARFGWRPFLMELDALLDLLKDSDAFSERHTARGKSSRTVENTVVTQTGGDLNFTYQNVQSATYEARAGFLYRSVFTMEDHVGFRWADVPSAAWELIPFSFVVDWFLNVGSYIQAISPKSGIECLAAWTKTKVTLRSELTCTAITLSGSLSGRTVQRIPSGQYVTLNETWSRAPAVSWPALVFNTSISDALRNNRGVDALSLFYQTFLGQKQSRFR